MEDKIEQLKEENNEDEYYSGASKKRRNISYPISYKILIFITIISCLISLYLIYHSYTTKNSRSFLEFAESRFSVRKFSEKPVEQEKIDTLLRALQIAPTAENKQPQKIYIITKEEDRKKLKTVTKYAFNAPMYFLVCCDKNKAWKHNTEEYYSTEIAYGFQPRNRCALPLNKPWRYRQPRHHIFYKCQRAVFDVGKIQTRIS